MSLLGSTDGISMLGACGWACVRPVRKHNYNMNITLVSVLVGGVEVASVVADQLHLTGGAWTPLATLGDNFGALGFAIVGIFIVSWTSRR